MRITYRITGKRKAVRHICRKTYNEFIVRNFFNVPVRIGLALVVDDQPAHRNVFAMPQGNGFKKPSRSSVTPSAIRRVPSCP